MVVLAVAVREARNSFQITIEEPSSWTLPTTARPMRRAFTRHTHGPKTAEFCGMGNQTMMKRRIISWSRHMGRREFEAESRGRGSRGTVRISGRRPSLMKTTRTPTALKTMRALMTQTCTDTVLDLPLRTTARSTSLQ